ncbi:dTDP-4-dehydrorhamnose 3,5-epimerase [Myxococcota bacterium]
MKFTFEPLAIPDILLVEHERYGDQRGSFAETFRASQFEAHGIGPLVQDNHSYSSRGVLRGLHFQNKPKLLGKLVRCLRGRIFDVSVDIRRGSSTYAKWVGIELTGDDNLMLWVPPGFAHGFCTLSDVADVLYRQTDYYSSEHERVILWRDPDIGIDWPLDDPILSQKDATAPLLKDADSNL